MKRYFLCLLFLPVLVLCPGALGAETGAPRITSVVHDAGTGRTTIKWQDAGFAEYNIYRSGEPIDARSIFFATPVALHVPAGKGEVANIVNGSGDFYYAVLGCSRSGVEKKVFAKENTFGPVRETDRTPPSAVTVERTYEDGRAVISWNVPPVDNPENIVSYLVYKGPTPVDNAKKPPVYEKIPLKFVGNRTAFRDDSPLSAKSAVYYAVSAVDASGNISAVSNSVRAALMPELCISGGNCVAMNPDTSITKMYPRAGERVTLEARIHNNGAVAAERVAVTVDELFQGRSRPLHKTVLANIPPGGADSVKFAWTPERAGVYNLRLQIDPAGAIEELEKSNNGATLEVVSVEKDVYFVWYGTPMNVVNSNVPRALTCDVQEWNRRGALTSPPAGIYGDAASLTGAWNKGYRSVVIDEFGTDATPELSKCLDAMEEAKKKCPELVLAAWQIGRPAERVVQLLKKGVISLIIPEIYLVPGSPLDPLERAVKEMQKLGISDKVVIGLVTDKGWVKDATADEHVKYIGRQLELIRRLAPEMPGVAFWSDNTKPGVREGVDKLCFQYFLSGNATK